MNIGLVTIAALLLLLPGVGFIVGVNFADKNVREIVFRNTPAELGYVIVVSVAIHLLFALAAQKWTGLAEFNSAYLYAHYSSIDKAKTAVDPNDALNFLVVSLKYYLAATLAGFVPGYLLGRFIRLPLRGRAERLAANFVKHRWLMNLVRRSRQGVVYAYVLLKDSFVESKISLAPASDADGSGAASADKTANSKLEKIDFRVVIHGTVQDSFFASDGTMLYMVFESYTAVWADGSGKVALKGLDGASEPDDRRTAFSGPLVIEGKNIALVRFTRVPIPSDVLDELENLPTSTAR